MRRLRGDGRPGQVIEASRYTLVQRVFSSESVYGCQYYTGRDRLACDGQTA